MVRNYFKTAWRHLKSNKLYAFINILGLSLGICACLIIYLITSFELSYDTFHPDKERIYRIVASQQNSQGKIDNLGGMMNPLPTTVRNELTGFETVTTFHNYYAKVTIPNGNRDAKKFEAAKRGEDASPIIITDPQYFDIFKYQWLEGNAATALNEPFKVVLSESEAYKYFGPVHLEEIIGRDIFYKDVYLNDSLHLTVSGIVKDWNKNTDFGFKDFISLETVKHSFLSKEIQLDHWGNWSPDAQGFVKLVKGITPAQIERQFPGFVKAHIPPYPGFKQVLSLQPLSDFHFNSLYNDFYSRKAHLPTLYGLMAIAAFILIIAAINFINLSTAQSLYRAKEIGVRKVLGGSKTSLTTQFLAETFITTLFSVIISVVITNPVITMLHSVVPAGVALTLFNPGVFIFLFLITIITTLLAGFYPARILSSYLPALSLKGQGLPRLSRNGYLRKSLIVFQFIVSLVFIISTLIIGNQMHFIQNKDLGFTKDAIVTFHTTWNTPANQVSLFAENIKQIPGIQTVSLHMETPAAKEHSQTFISTADIKTDASYEMADENYVPLFGLKIIAGRNISHSDTIKEFLVNEACVKGLGFTKPEYIIGKVVQTGVNEKKGIVVGVIKDFYSKSLHEAITPFFISSFKENEKAISVKLQTQGGKLSDFKTHITQIQNIWNKIYPDQKFEYSFFDESIARLYDTEQKTVRLMNMAMIIAIFISCMGLFGLVTFTAQQREKEIGIRKVLGANVASIISMLSKDFLSLIIVAMLIASPVAYYFMHEWLQGFAYRVNINFWLFLLSGIAAMVIALITISFQAIKAALANPVKSLRSE